MTSICSPFYSPRWASVGGCTHFKPHPNKWLRGGALADEPFVVSADILPLADLANSYEVVQTMRIAPITREAVIRLAAPRHWCRLHRCYSP